MSNRRSARTLSPASADPDDVRAVNSRLRADQIAALDQVKHKVGIPIAEQIRRAVDLWLATQGGK